MHVLVFGGAGYIGSHVCKALKKAGFIPVVFDNFSSGHRWAVQWGPYVEGDILNLSLLNKILLHYCPIGIIHLASLIDVRESVANPTKYFQTNVGGSLALLQAVLAQGIRPIVFSSSAAVYGAPKTTPIPESHPKNPVSPYGRTKLIVEELLSDLFHAHGLPSISLRYFNAAGADPEGEIGESHNPETHLIPSSLLAALKKRPPLAIYGTDHATADGTAIRDYIHVTDLADAHVKALQHLLRHPTALSLNLGTGQGYSVHHVLALAQEVAKCPIPNTIGPKNSSDPPILVAEAQQARTLLHWEPRYSSLPTILETAWQWHLQRVNY
jgi:UDP-arabinose 4-epimerase